MKRLLSYLLVAMAAVAPAWAQSLDLESFKNDEKAQWLIANNYVDAAVAPLHDAIAAGDTATLMYVARLYSRIGELDKAGELASVAAQNGMYDAIDFMAVISTTEQSIEWSKTKIRISEQNKSPRLSYDYYDLAAAYFMNEQWDEGVKYFEKSAKLGNTDAMNMLGKFYLGDIPWTDIKTNHKKAVSWFTKAADAGNEDACWRLAMFYLGGKDRVGNKEKASYWFSRINEDSNFYDQAQYYMDNFEQAQRDFEVFRDDTNNYFAELPEPPHDKVDESCEMEERMDINDALPEHAAELLEQLADAGDAEAMYLMWLIGDTSTIDAAVAGNNIEAMCTYTSMMLEQDPDCAYDMMCTVRDLVLKRAAEGDIDANLTLAENLLCKEGVSKILSFGNLTEADGIAAVQRLAEAGKRLKAEDDANAYYELSKIATLRYTFEEEVKEINDLPYVLDANIERKAMLQTLIDRLIFSPDDISNDPLIQAALKGNAKAQALMLESCASWSVNDAILLDNEISLVKLLAEKLQGDDAFTRHLHELAQKSDSQIIYDDAFELPGFPGGTEGLSEYIRNNLHYPEDAERAGITGKVLLRFVVRSDGTMSDLTLLRSSGNDSLDAEALRLAKLMPMFRPGRDKEGNPINVYYTLPLTFTLE